jgi:hypothetical protein
VYPILWRFPLRKEYLQTNIQSIQIKNTIRESRAQEKNRNNNVRAKRVKNQEIL